MIGKQWSYIFYYISNIKNSRSLIGDNLADMLDSGKIENKINYDKSTIYNIEFSKQL
jgi:hypothetical protein